MKTSRVAILIPTVCLLFLFVACDRLGLFPVPIAKIVDNPREYQDKSVHIRGEVTAGFSLLVVSYFTLKDDSGEIFVITSRALPGKGQKFDVKGKVGTYSIADKNVTVVFEEEKKR